MVAWAIPAAIAGSAFISGMFNHSAQKSANNANVSFWREQAEYNTPENQMKRLKDAGLNPYLYANGVSGGEMSNSPTVNANTGIGDAFNQAGQMALNYGSRKMEYEIKKQAEQRMQDESDLRREVINKTTLDNDLLKIEKEKRQWELNQLKASYNKTNKDIMLNELSHALNIDKNQFEKQLKKNLYILELQKYKGKKSFDANLNIGPFGKIGGSFGWSNF